MLSKTKRLFDSSGCNAYLIDASSYACPAGLEGKIGLQPLFHLRKQLLNQ